MRILTFKGFLNQYVRTLSGMETNDIRRLASEIYQNYRLTEPLVLFAMSVNKMEYLKSITTNPVLSKAIQIFPENIGWEDAVYKLENNDITIPYEFIKVYNSYKSVRDRNKAEKHTKGLLHMQIKYLQQEKNVSTYRIYTDLGLNHGNVNAYLKYGDISKVSLEVAEKVLEYLAAK